ncbi:hypothetical protein JW756_00395 [Candidatus Woesearchaeota archaeon]|nr:hypothetical protein [Candidatus Woesearchaeota archaeon]
MRKIWLINTKIHPCDTGMFEDKIYLVNLEGRRNFIKRIREAGAADFDLPFLGLYRPNSQYQRPFLGPVRGNYRGLRRWDFQYDPDSAKILVGGAINDRMIGNLSICEYVLKLCEPNVLSKIPLRGIIQFLSRDADIKDELYPEEIARIERSRKVNLGRVYLGE